MNEPAVGEVRPEYVTPGWAERLARSIAPVRDISAEGDDAGLPEACRLLDVLGAEPPAAEAIAARWQAAGPSTYAVIGACYDGPFGIDLRRDGPHALIAGTTGAGKSELLQTLIASLALVNRPDEMTFVLVDYKGGSAFKDCVHLPHVTGMVTDLDAHLTQRALASLTAELTGREKILAAAGAKDIEEYTERAGHQPRLPLLPRLVIVIDEFASLARDLPDFVAGLVGIAQRGRSLGLHLILATQRPSGVVSADIRANTNLRIALRMTDVAESADVIDAPDAAHIARATPGRGYVRLGHASLVPFQAGRIGGRRPGADPGTAPARAWVRLAAWPDLGRPEPRRPAARQADDELTDLKVLVDQIRRAAAAPAHPGPAQPLADAAAAHAAAARPARPRQAAGAGAGAGPVRPHRPARPPAAAARRDQPGHLRAPDGGRRARGPGGPSCCAPSPPRSRSASAAPTSTCTASTAATARCCRWTDLPHCGAVVTRTQDERAARLLARLAAELTRRQDLLAADGFAGITEQRAAAPAGQRLPHILVLLDRWEGFTTTLGEAGGGSPDRRDHPDPVRGRQRRDAPGHDR